MDRPLWELLGYCSHDDYEKSGQKMEDEYNKQEEIEDDPRQIALDTMFPDTQSGRDAFEAAVDDALDIDPSSRKVTIGGHEIDVAPGLLTVGTNAMSLRGGDVNEIIPPLPRIWMGPHSDYVKHWHWTPETDARPGVWRLLREASLVQGDIFVRGDAEKPDSPEGMVALSTCKEIDWKAVERW